jgi:YD repeat-containing protein
MPSAVLDPRVRGDDGQRGPKGSPQRGPKGQWGLASGLRYCRFECSGRGDSTAIVAPDGQRMELALYANGCIHGITNPASETYHMVYAAGGLLQAFTDPRGHTSHVTYDALGRLIRDENAAGGSWDLARTEETSAYEITLASAEGRATTYRVENLGHGRGTPPQHRPGRHHTGDPHHSRRHAHRHPVRRERGGAQGRTRSALRDGSAGDRGTPARRRRSPAAAIVTGKRIRRSLRINAPAQSPCGSRRGGIAGSRR